MQKIVGSTTIARIKNQGDMDKFVHSLGLTSEYLIIKPNWVQARDGTYTDAKVLDMFLTAAKKKTVIVESYTFWRTDKYAVGAGDYFSSKEGDLIKGKQYWDHFKRQDQWFLAATGIGDVLKKHKVKYVNVTNEVWLGKAADTEVIKKITEEKYQPVKFKELYSYIPTELFDLKGSDFISFSKAKKEHEYSFTLSTKNLFGLIPDPTRYPKYHGDDDELLAESIADINKIYRSLFNCIFVVDGVFTASWNKSMEESMPVKDWGVILGGMNSIEVDMIGASLLKAEAPQDGIDTLAVSKDTFGSFNDNLTAKIPEEFLIKY